MRLSSCCFCMSLYIGSIFIGVYIAVSSDDFVLDLKGLNSALTKTVCKNIIFNCLDFNCLGSFVV